MIDPLSRYQGLMHNVLRIVVGFLWMPHGAQKLFGFLRDSGGTEPFTRTWFAGIIEFVGGILIMLGLFTPVVAFIGAGEMAAAYFIAHLPQGFWPIVNRGELAALYCFIYLYFVTTGAGSFSLDALIRKKRGGTASSDS